MATLNTYITQVRRLLHDANANFYTDQQITDYVNSARYRVVRDTGCLREIVVAQTPCLIDPNTTINGVAPTNPVYWTANTAYTLNTFIVSNIFIYQVTTAGTTDGTAPPYPSNSTNNYTNYPPTTQFFNGTCGLTYVGNAEIISLNALTYLVGSSPLAPSSNTQVVDIMNVNLYWGNSRVPLDYLPWTNFNAKLRYWQNYIGRPVAFSMYGEKQMYIGPVPDQIYQIEVDCIVQPNDLSLNLPNATDQIGYPYTEPVQFYAAYLAKYYEQSFGESAIYEQEYKKQLLNVVNTVYTRRIPSAYSSAG